MDNNSIKHNLRHFRVRRKVTQKEMADQLGMTRSNYLCIENGDTRLISETIDKFAAVVGVSVEEVLLGYKPCRDAARVLQETKANYARERKELVEGYEAQLEEYREKVELRDKVIKAQEKALAALDEQLRQLQRRLEE
ncbi:MAG: helix-turn-helix domain-containing protein [Candidatus Cryptobacteroides sp.]